MCVCVCVCVSNQRDAQFLQSTVFLSTLHVSNESSRSSSEARHNILCYTVWYNRYNRAAGLACTIVPIVPNCVIQYIMQCS